VRNTQKLQAHIPMLVHPNPKEVCQIGFGSGETAHLFTTYDLQRFDCIEISQAIMDMAAEHFTDINHGVVQSPKLNTLVMDGSTYLKYTARTYDVIANDSIWPHLAGNSALYTLEYFRNGRAHLKPGGIMTSWLPLELPLEDLKTLLKTFREVFPHAYLWSALSHQNKHGLLIGAQEPLQIDAARFLVRLSRYGREDLEAVHLSDPAVFLSSHLAVLDGMEADLDKAPLNTEDLPILQFLGSRPDVFRHPKRRKIVPNALRLLARHRDSVLRRLTNLEVLDGPEGFVGQVRLMENATSHLLRAFGMRYDSPRESELEFRNAWRLAPDHPAFVLGVPGVEMTPDLSQAQLRQSSLEVLKALAHRALSADRPAQALAAYGEWARRDANSDEAQAGLGLSYLKDGRPDKGVSHLKKALELNPGQAGAHIGLATFYMQTASFGAARRHLEKLLEAQPDSPEVHRLLAQLYTELGDQDAAGRHAHRAKELEARQRSMPTPR
ncbi:MAG: spermine/spermidine synthase domain-containing protein, partial [Planctomycetota bacterium]|jgi:spermidine synthase/cytochrome c-type biogenesis protein CcmH/NrfG